MNKHGGVIFLPIMMRDHNAKTQVPNFHIRPGLFCNSLFYDRVIIFN